MTNKNDDLHTGSPAGGFDDLPDDPFIGSSLDNLSKISVPADFLPNVMYRVYEKDARQRINLPMALGYGLLLLLLSVAALFWDVSSYQSMKELASFEEAFEARFAPFRNSADELFGAFGGMLNASWQLLEGWWHTSPGTFWGLVFAVIGLVALVWWQRNYLTRRTW